MNFAGPICSGIGCGLLFSMHFLPFVFIIFLIMNWLKKHSLLKPIDLVYAALLFGILIVFSVIFRAAQVGEVFYRMMIIMLIYLSLSDLFAKNKSLINLVALGLLYITWSILPYVGFMLFASFIFVYLVKNYLRQL